MLVTREEYITQPVVVQVPFQPYLGGVMVLSVECRTHDQEVVGLTLGRAHGIKTLGKFSHLCASVHQAVHLRVVMPCGWGVKAGMVRVWVAGKPV